MVESNAFMSVHFLPTFIEVYKSHECLWKTKTKDYNNKALRDTAYRELVELTKQVVPNCDMDFVKRKIEVIRGSFRREHKKVQASLEAGGGADTVHFPKLWYYNSLLFMAEHEDKLLSRRSVKEEDTEIVGVYEEEANSSEAYYDESVTTEEQGLFEQAMDCQNTGMLPASTINTSVKRPRLEKAASILTSSEEDEYDLFGKCVAAQLRNMDAMQSIFAQNVINQALFKGKLHKLQEDTRLSV